MSIDVNQTEKSNHLAFGLPMSNVENKGEIDKVLLRRE
jgi:hypothetical protein